MQKSRLVQPVLIYMFGLPGSGKSFVARQISEDLGMAHISGDRLRFELFENPKHDKTEHLIVSNLMNYMAEEFLNIGVSVVYDISVNRLSERRTLKDLAASKKAKDLLIWTQIDVDSAWARIQNRDRRKSDDKYSDPLSQEIFERYMKNMQNPQNENYLVLSGKHLYNSQKTSLTRKLKDMGVMDIVDHNVAKPELVNLVPRSQAQAGRVDMARRNIAI